MRFLFLEPFFGGSHRDVAEGLTSHSRHEIDLYTLPASFWKWRMRGAALHFVRAVPPLAAYDGLIVTDLMSLSDLLALAGPDAPPSLVYFHENQLTYPLSPGETIDYQFGFTNITTALAANSVRFNSRTHRDAFFANLPGFLRMMPDHQPRWIIDAIREKSGVLYPGCRFSDTEPPLAPLASTDANEPPLIIWSHRWEFDKGPEAFFSALEAVRARGGRFRLALLGERFSKIPPAFASARERFSKEIVQFGYLESRDDYFSMLRDGTIVVSTAVQENFGISVVEAMRMGCLPLLPDRLSYPEILPKPFHRDLLYRSQDDLVDKLSKLLRDPIDFEEARHTLSREMGKHAWQRRISEYDALLEAVANCHK